MKSQSPLLAACALAVIACPLLAFSASAAEMPKTPSMKMDEPMSGEMKKKGMKQGDVKKQEQKWDQKMKEMIGKEEEKMNEGNTKKQPAVKQPQKTGRRHATEWGALAPRHNKNPAEAGSVSLPA